MYTYRACNNPDTRSTAQREMYRSALIRARRENGGFFGRLMLQLGI